MAKTKDEIIAEIKSFIANHGESIVSWYVGICDDARDKLFNNHFVDRNYDFWIYRVAPTSEDAKNIGEYFVKTVGTDGATEISGSSAVMVYAYRKTTVTNP